jgi:aspartyl-tRNA(Asn)/glutamyl-tRNA(Gln) amidotransferase subunit A
MAAAREDARLYDVGAGIEALLESRWGGPLWAKAPALG